MKSSGNKTLRDIGTLVVFWTAVVFVATLLDARSIDGRFFQGVPPVPVQANPRLFSVGVMVTLLASGFALFGIYSFRWIGRLSVILPAVGLLLGTGILLASMGPSAGALVSRESVRPSPPKQSESVFAVPVYFANGSYKLEPAARAQLKDVYETFTTCGTGDVRLRGFASSAPFRRKDADSDLLNLELANKRTIVIQQFLKDNAGIEAQIDSPWGAYSDMAKARRIRDVDVEGARVRARERLNRRVELYWTATSCVALSSTPSVPPVSISADQPKQ